MTKHVHADVIHAYAEGKKIQFFDEEIGKWVNSEYPSFFPSIKYRVKPLSVTYFRSYDVFNLSVSHAANYKRIEDRVISVVAKPGEQLCFQITVQPE